MLNDSQKMVLKGIAENKATFECLKEYLIECFNANKVSTQMTNEEIGMMVRAKLDGINVIESAFREIASCKTQEVQQTGINPAR